MPRPRFLKLAAEKRAAILRAAKTEFSENGYDAASYNRIIEQAGLSKGAMYYYFDDKLDVYATVLEDVNREMMALMGIDETWRPEGPFWETMREISRKAWSFTIEHPELAALIKGLAALPRNVKQTGRLAELYGQWRHMLVGMLEVGQAQGEVRSDRPLALLVEVAVGLDEAVDFWLIDHLDELADNPVEEVVDMVLDFWERLLRP